MLLKVKVKLLFIIPVGEFHSLRSTLPVEQWVPTPEHPGDYSMFSICIGGGKHSTQYTEKPFGPWVKFKLLDVRDSANHFNTVRVMLTPTHLWRMFVSMFDFLCKIVISGYPYAIKLFSVMFKGAVWNFWCHLVAKVHLKPLLSI